jgi:hypothetical protein
MPRAGLSLLLLVGCVSSLSPATDSGSDGPGPSACLVPSDGGVLAVRPATPAPGCALGPRDGGLMDLGSLGLALQGGLLSIPDAPAGVALPVVFVFHGAGSTGAAARTYGLEAAADGGAIFVYPDAVHGTWDVGGRSADARRVELALRRLSETRCIDPDRVYVTGFSAGAVFTLYLGCNVPTAFRAMAVIAGSDWRFDTRCCQGAISALFIHGTADDTIPSSTASLPGTARWAGTGAPSARSPARRAARPTTVRHPGRSSSAPGPAATPFRTGLERRCGASSARSPPSSDRRPGAIPAGVAPQDAGGGPRTSSGSIGAPS